MKWTKKDIRTLCNQIMTFYVMNRPLGDSSSAYANFQSALATHLERFRTEVVLGGLRGWVSMSTSRADQYQRTADNAIANPHVWGKSTCETVDRFEKLAAESRKAIRLTEKLIARVEAEGLPPEVVAFEPGART